jgi:hypothetical protein
LRTKPSERISAVEAFKLDRKGRFDVEVVEGLMGAFLGAILVGRPPGPEDLTMLSVSLSLGGGKSSSSGGGRLLSSGKSRGAMRSSRERERESARERETKGEDLGEADHQ